MPEILEPSARVEVESTVWADVVRVCRRIPPLWDLSGYVAVNPFLGFMDRPIDDASREIGEGLGAKVLPPVAFYRERWKAGDFGPGDLVRAAERRGWDASLLEDILDGRRDAPTRAFEPALTFAERHDRRRGTTWDDAVVRQISRWCAVYGLGGGTFWKLADAPKAGLYASWREAAKADRSLEILGLPGWRMWAASLPETPREAIAAMLARGRVAHADREAYLYRLLKGVYGWASFLRRDGWSRGSEHPGLVADLLAIRACADAAVAESAPRSGGGSASDRAEVEDESARLVLQDALEDGFVGRVLGRFNLPMTRHARQRPAVQAVFCIDVRSEPMRRHLEAQSEAIETRGFAGFFGVSLDWCAETGRSSARCPVLLKPAVTARSQAKPPSAAMGAAAKHLLATPASAFNFVEVLGLGYGLGLAADAMALVSAKPSDEKTAPFVLERGGEGMSAESRVDLAASLLKNMGLRDRIARLVLLCGHEGHSANNPHAAGLDCGACGGHGGAVNARVAAALLNDASVREGLRDRGTAIPDDTVFVAGVHDTSIDEVMFLDTDRIPASHSKDLRLLGEWLEQAGALSRAERASSLGLSKRPASVLDRVLRRRARDWSEVRPEWGLARNAAFIAARRDRTRGINLQGRAFLHEYDASLDEDGSVLTLILSAPMVVASWINLQYFASTVDNSFLGCGNKTLHNRVGNLGVVLGNGGDLRTGLAMQSVHAPDGQWFHEPLRLQVVVEAPTEKIDEVINTQKMVRDLVENGWVRLFALDPDGVEMYLRVSGGGWERVKNLRDRGKRGD